MAPTGSSRKTLWWILGIVGALIVLAAIGVLLWQLVFKPSAPADTRLPTPIVALETAQPATSTAIPLPVTATTTPTLPPAPTASATFAPATATSAPATAATITLVPTFTLTPAATLTLPSTLTLTPAPSATLPPAPYGSVNAGAANVRQGPGQGYPVIAQAIYGQSLLLLGRSANAGWYYVQLPAGQIGWISASLVAAPAGLSLPVIAAPPLPTPTPWPTPAPWPTPRPTPIPWPTYTPWPTPIPWPTPAPTIPPTSTATPVPPACAISVAGPFIGVWSASERAELGCPVETVRETWTAIERFERGVMLWREDQRMIYVLSSDGVWRKVADAWIEGMPQYACADVPPAGLVKPQRGFGIVWCTAAGMKSLVGWALEEEHGFTTQYQTFQNGEMIRAEDNSVYVLSRSGLWRRYQ